MNHVIVCLFAVGNKAISGEKSWCETNGENYCSLLLNRQEGIDAQVLLSDLNECRISDLLTGACKSSILSFCFCLSLENEKRNNQQRVRGRRFGCLSTDKKV